MLKSLEGCKESDMTEQLNTTFNKWDKISRSFKWFFHTASIWQNHFQISFCLKCLPRDAKRRERDSKSEGEGAREHGRGERGPWPSGPSFCFFLPPGPTLCKLDYLGVLFLLLTPVLGLSFDLPLFYFCGLFPSLSFGHQRFGLLCPILTT